MTYPIPLHKLSTEEKYTDFLIKIEAETGKQIDEVTLSRSKDIAEIKVIFKTN